MYRIALATACVAGLVALTGCAGTGATPEQGGTATTPGVTMTPSTTPSPGTGEPSDPGTGDPGATGPTLDPPAPTQFPPGGEVTVTGMVMVSEVEMGCLILEGYELVGGDPAVVRAGQRVRVTGRVATDMASTCQQGPILMVTSAQPV